MKVHGSINLFHTPDNKFIESDVWVMEAPSVYVIAWRPPGDAKNTVVANHREWFAEADIALKSTGAFLVIGYGFNDPHIHDIVKRRAETGTPIIILTRDPTDKLDALTEIAEDVWVITADYNDNGDVISDKTRIVNQKYPDPLGIDKNIWVADNFTRQIMGD